MSFRQLTETQMTASGCEFHLSRRFCLCCAANGNIVNLRLHQKTSVSSLMCQRHWLCRDAQMGDDGPCHPPLLENALTPRHRLCRSPVAIPLCLRTRTHTYPRGRWTRTFASYTCIIQGECCNLAPLRQSGWSP